MDENGFTFIAIQSQISGIIDSGDINITAFAIADGGSKRISQSQILPGLKLEILTEALRKSRDTNHTEVGSWLMQQFQQN